MSGRFRPRGQCRCRRKTPTPAKRLLGDATLASTPHNVLVRITRKLADHINGVDLSRMKVDDIVDLPSRDADILIREGWAPRAEGSTKEDEAAPSDKRKSNT